MTCKIFYNPKYRQVRMYRITEHGLTPLGPVDLEDIQRAGLGDAPPMLGADGLALLSDGQADKLMRARADRLMPAGKEIQQALCDEALERRVRDIKVDGLQTHLFSTVGQRGEQDRDTAAIQIEGADELLKRNQ